MAGYETLISGRGTLGWGRLTSHETNIPFDDSHLFQESARQDESLWQVTKVSVGKKSGKNFLKK